MITVDELEKLVYDASFKGTTDAINKAFEIPVEPVKTEKRNPELFPEEKQNGEFTEAELNEGISIIQAADLVGCREPHIKREMAEGHLHAYRKTGSPKGHFRIKRREVLEQKQAIIHRILRR